MNVRPLLNTEIVPPSAKKKKRTPWIWHVAGASHHHRGEVVTDRHPLQSGRYTRKWRRKVSQQQKLLDEPTIKQFVPCFSWTKRAVSNRTTSVIEKQPSPFKKVLLSESNRPESITIVPKTSYKQMRHLWKSLDMPMLNGLWENWKFMVMWNNTPKVQI